MHCQVTTCTHFKLLQMRPGVVYKFSVKVTNYLGKESATAYAMSKRVANKLITLQLRGPEGAVRPDLPQRLTAYYRTDTCAGDIKSRVEVSSFSYITIASYFLCLVNFVCFSVMFLLFIFSIFFSLCFFCYVLTFRCLYIFFPLVDSQ